MLEFNSGRQRAANYIMICKNIADSYPDGIAHGLQKDAIQNAVDARRRKKAVRVVFELIDNPNRRLFTITDSNTTGLTGPVLYGLDAYEEDLPSDYHWARFESFAFTKDDPNAIGARGQGKFIFLGSSHKYTMYYDTLREDGIYRLGGTQATKTGCPILPPEDVKPWEGEEAARELLDRTGLKPLTEMGTRIIVVDPIEELCESVRAGDFARAIEETWFRMLEKQLLAVIVKTGEDTRNIGIPFPYPLSMEDTKNTKIWRLGRDFHDREIDIAGGLKFRVKSFHVAYLGKGVVPERMSGISIIHNGMKITSLDMAMAPQEVKSKIVGFIEFDSELDQELRKGENQHPNHYDLKWRKRIPFAIKGYVTKQLEEFGTSKLGLGKDPREIKHSRRTSAEDWAVRQLMKHAVGLDLFGAKGKGGPNPPPPPPPQPPKPVGVSINHFSYPDPQIAPRVNWGSSFRDLMVSGHNQTKQPRELSLLVQVLLGDTTIYEPFDRTSFSLSSQQVFHSEPFGILVDREKFVEPGVYRLNASLFDAKTGDRIDSVNRRFWVEKDPPLRQPFEIQGLAEFPEAMRFRQWYTNGSVNDSPVLYYNMAHPCYRTAEDDQDTQNEYLFEVTLAGAIQFVLNRPNQEDGAADLHPLRSEYILGDQKSREREEIPNLAYDEIQRYVSEVRWKVFEGE